MAKLRPQTLRHLHGLLADATAVWDQPGQPESLRRYVLAYGAVHLRATEDHNRLWQLLRSEDYRRAQLDAFQQYEASYRALREAIELYVERQGQAPDDDPRLCWLALRAGELGNEAQGDIAVAFEWVQERPLEDLSRMEEALQRISVLDEVEFYKAALLLLWIEVDRQVELPEAERSDAVARLVLQAVEERIPTGSETVDWSTFLSVDFVAWLALHVVEVLPGLEGPEGERLFAYTTEYERYVESLIEHLARPNQLEATSASARAHFALTASASTGNAVLLTRLGVRLLSAGVTEPAHKALTHALAVTDQIENTGALSEIGQILLQSGASEHAQHFFEKALQIAVERQDSIDQANVLAAVADALTLTHEQSSPDDVDRPPPSLRPKAVTLSALAQALANAEQLPHPGRLLRSALVFTTGIEDPLGKTTALANLAAALAHVGEAEQGYVVYEEALAVLRTIGGSWTKSSALATVTETLARARNLPHRGELFWQALGIADDAQLNASALFSVALPGNDPQMAELLRDWLKVGRSTEVRRLFFAMALAAECEGLSALAHALVASVHPERARKVFEETLRRIRKIENTSRRIAAMCAYARALTYAGELNRARNVLQETLDGIHEVEKEWDKDERLTVLVRVLAQLQELPHAGHLLVQTLAVHQAISGWERRVLLAPGLTSAERGELLPQAVAAPQRAAERLSLLTQALVRAHDFGQGLELARSIGTPYGALKADAVSALAEALQRVPNLPRRIELVQQTLQLAYTITNNRAKIRALLAVAQVHAQAGDSRMAVDIYRAALDGIRTIEDPMSKGTALADLSRALMALDDQAKRLELASICGQLSRAIPPSRGQAVALAALVQLQLQDTKPELAQPLHHIVLGLAQAGNDDYWFLSALARALVQRPTAEQARQSLENALQTTRTQDDKRTATMVSAISNWLSQVEVSPDPFVLFAKAAEIAYRVADASAHDDNDDVNDRRRQAEALFASLAFVNPRDLPQRAQLFRLLLDAASVLTGDEPKARTVSAVAAALARARDAPARLELVQYAARRVRSIRSDLQRAWALSAVAEALAQSGDRLWARQTFQQTFEVTHIVEDDSQRNETLSALAAALCSAKAPECALEVTQMIEDAEQQKEALSRIACSLVRADDRPRQAKLFRQARAIANAINEAWLKDETLCILAQALAQAGELERALAIADTIRTVPPWSQVMFAVTKALPGVERQSRRTAIFRQLLRQGSRRRPTGTGWGEEPEWRVRVLAVLAHSLAGDEGLQQRTELFVEFLQAVREIEYAPEKTHALSALVRALAETSKRRSDQVWLVLREAIRVARTIEYYELRAVALSAIGGALAQTGIPAAARLTFGESQLCFEHALELTEVNDAHWSSLAEAIAEAEDLPNRNGIFRRALDLAHAIRDPSNRVHALTALAQGLAGAAQSGWAGQVFADALEVTCTEQTETLLWSTMQCVVNGLSSAAEFPQRAALLHQILGLAPAIVGPPATVPLLATVVEALASSAEPATILEAAEALDDYTRAMMVRALARKLAWREDIPQREELIQVAIQVYRMSSANRSESDVLVDLARASAAEQLLQRSALCRQLLELAIALEEETRTRVLSALAPALARVDDVLHGTALFLQALDVVRRTEHDVLKGKLLSALAPAVRSERRAQAFRDLAESSNLSEEVRCRALHGYRQAIVRHLANPRPWLRASFRLHPFSSQTAYNGVRAMHLACLNAGDVDTFDSISHHCPELRLNIRLHGN